AADGTLLETVRESRWLPELKIMSLSKINDYIFTRSLTTGSEQPNFKMGL
ncbi:hypothetical protein HMPREF9457_03836, partial [Dorea formicigenerans 4_6_53AFAA]